MTRRIAVVGGGVTGLTAAYYLLRMAREAGIGAEVSLWEKAPRLGGKVETLRRDGFVIERGPDSFLARKRPIIDLSKDLGIENELVTLNPATRKTYILRGGKLHRIPPGLVLGVPTEWKPFLASRLIGWTGKLRAALDFVLPPSREESDESLGGFLRRRLGDQVVDFVAEPLLSGIYAGDADRLSLLATFPQFRAAERKHRSLIAGLGRGAGATREGAAGEDHLPAHARGSAFLSYRRGLSTLIERLADAIREEGGLIATGTGVRSVTPRAGGGAVLAFENGEPLEADAVVLTAPPPALGALLPGVSSASLLGGMKYASVANIVLGYRTERLGTALDGSGFVVPRKEGLFMTACTWTSAKWKHTAPEGRTLIRCYVGRADDERWIGMTDDEIAAAVRRELKEIMHLDAEPDFADVKRLMHSMPQYEVGHPDRMRALQEGMAAEAPGVIACGAGFDGVGLPDCVRQGKHAAEQLLRYLAGK